jgi:luciferase family oxidoreductase group 1
MIGTVPGRGNLRACRPRSGGVTLATDSGLRATGDGFHRIPLSILDTSPVASGRTPADALAETLDIAQLADAAGYHRYWVAEHHGMPGGASSAPAVLIAAIADHTRSIRVGSGGVMLPNHAPLVIAEQFGTLEALHQGRIDLGLGRAPGSDQLTAYALRRWQASRDGDNEDDFTPRLAELLAFFDGDFGGDHPFARIQATPARGYTPQVWLLGSSDFSARLAGQLGLRFAFANHFSGHDTAAVARIYRTSFQPSPDLAAPHLLVTANAIAAPDAEQARVLAEPIGLFFTQLRSGRPGPWPSAAEVAAHPWTAAERAMAQERVDGVLTGSPAEVVAKLEQLAAATGADELMVTTMTHEHAARRRSVELLADAWRTEPALAGSSIGSSAG